MQVVWWSAVVVVCLVGVCGGRQYEGWRAVRVYGDATRLKEVMGKLASRRDLVLLSVNTASMDLAVSPNTSLSLFLGSTNPSGQLSRTDKTPHTALKKTCTEGGGDTTHAGEVEEVAGKRQEMEAVAEELECRVLHHDLGAILSSDRLLTGKEQLSWDGYYRYESIARFCRVLARRSKVVEVVKYGESVEGRPLLALIIGSDAKKMKRLYMKNIKSRVRKRGAAEIFNHITKNTIMGREKETEIQTTYNRRKRQWSRKMNIARSLGNQLRKSQSRRPKKPVIFVEAGAHAREWISPAVATYLAQEAGGTGKKVLKHATFIIAPVTNPDGYEYSHTDNRLWRKNRRVTSEPECLGVDLNRNWDIAWDSEEGSSGEPCAADYRGTAPFSENETRALKTVADVFIKRISLFVSMHSFGQYVLYPWSYTTARVEKYRKLRSMMEKIAQALNKHGVYNYTSGQSSGQLYLTSGVADDYMYSRGVPYAFTLELPDQSTFLLPPEEIVPSARQVWAGLVCFIGYYTKNKAATKLCQRL